MIYWEGGQTPIRLVAHINLGSIGFPREIDALSVSQRRFSPGWTLASVMISDQGCHSHLKVPRDHSSSHAALATRFWCPFLVKSFEYYRCCQRAHSLPPFLFRRHVCRRVFAGCFSAVRDFVSVGTPIIVSSPSRQIAVVDRVGDFGGRHS